MLVLFVAPGQIAMATPAGFSSAGATMNQSGNNTNVNITGNSADIGWTNFDTNINEVVNFNGTGPFVAINRISGAATQFNGTLNGNQGHIILINTNGIVFGPESLVTARKFTASALDLISFDILNGEFKFEKGEVVGDIINEGEISAELVALIGNTVKNTNTGIINSDAGTTIMAAGDNVYITEGSSNVSVRIYNTLSTCKAKNYGEINAGNGSIIMAAGDTYSLAFAGLSGIANSSYNSNSTVTQSSEFATAGTIILNAAGNITLGKEATVNNDVTINGNEIIAKANITSKEGSIDLTANDIIRIKRDVVAEEDVTFNSKVQFYGNTDQLVKATNGSVDAKETLSKINAYGSKDLLNNSLYIKAGQNVALADDVTVTTGGVSIIAEGGKVYTPGVGKDDTLDVVISGAQNPTSGRYSEDGDPINGAPGNAVNLPKDYDVKADHNSQAAIVVMSKDNLVLGENSQFNVSGVYDTSGTVDDRAGVDFLNYDIPADKKPAGDPIDIALYLASDDGNVYMNGGIGGIPEGGVMVLDAMNTITFGDNFMASLEAGNVNWLELCSRVSSTLSFAYNNGTLPFVYDSASYTYGKLVLRGEGPDVGTGAWILGDEDPVPFSNSEEIGAERVEMGVDGCPALVQAAAEELGTSPDEIQVSMQNSFALNTNIQPCEACAKVVNAANILKETQGTTIATLNQVVGQFVTTDAPLTEEGIASINQAIAINIDNAEMPEYASTSQWLNAMADYVAVVNEDIGWSQDDAVAFALEKYGAPEEANEAVAIFIASQLVGNQG